MLKRSILYTLTVFFFFICSAKAENRQIIPLGGNSYITSSTTAKITDKGFVDWVSPEIRYSTFFRVNEAGNLRLFLAYTTEQDGSEIKITCLDKSFNTVLSKQDTIVFVGEVACSKAGYVKVDFQGLKKNGETYLCSNSGRRCGKEHELCW